MKVQSLLKKKPAQAVREAEDLLRKDPLNPTFVNAASARRPWPPTCPKWPS
jgi:hypothetical protein